MLICEDVYKKSKCSDPLSVPEIIRAIRSRLYHQCARPGVRELLRIILYKRLARLHTNLGLAAAALPFLASPLTAESGIKDDFEVLEALGEVATVSREARNRCALLRRICIHAAVLWKELGCVRRVVGEESRRN